MLATLTTEIDGAIAQSVRSSGRLLDAWLAAEIFGSLAVTAAIVVCVVVFFRRHGAAILTPRCWNCDAELRPGDINRITAGGYYRFVCNRCAKSSGSGAAKPPPKGPPIAPPSPPNQLATPGQRVPGQCVRCGRPSGKHALCDPCHIESERRA